MACTKSAPITQIDRDGTDSGFRDQHLADYDARLRQEDLLLPNPNAAPRANALGDGSMAQPGTVGMDDPLPL